MPSTLSPTEFEVLARTRDALARAAHGDKEALIAEAARQLKCSPQTVYRKLKQADFDSGRKRRSDAGRTDLSEAELQLIAGVLLTSANNKGQRMPINTAIDMLRASGQLRADVSPGTVSRQLHQHRLHPDQLTLPSPSVQLRSRHPNHVWQVDSTTGAYYYLPGGRLRWMPEDEFYKNKVRNLVKASPDLLTRYAAVDHTSHAFKVRHCLGGESMVNLLDFLAWAMWKQEASPMHGVPFILMLDPGAANKSRGLKLFCQRLGIKPMWHAPGAARVTGSVEKSHDLVRMHFETRLRFEDPSLITLETLNAKVEAWTVAHCSSKVHTRHGRPRYAVWMEIEPEQLRVAASLEALQEAAMKEPETRRVSNAKTIEFAGSGGTETYDLTLVPGVVAGLKVTVVQNPFRAPAIDVLFVDQESGEETWHVVEPIGKDRFGFPENVPFIDEGMRTAAYSDVDHNRVQLTRQAYRTGDGLPTVQEAAKARKAHAQAFLGIVDAMADVKAASIPTYLPRRASTKIAPERRIEGERLNLVTVCTQLKRALGTRYRTDLYLELKARFPYGVPASIVPELLAAEQGRADDGPARQVAS